MEEASCEKAAYVSTYLNKTDGFSVIQGAAARIRPSRLPEDYFSCKLLSITPDFPFLPALQHHLVSVCVKPVWLTLSLCFPPQLTMRVWWRTCRYAKYSKCDFCVDKKKERLSACLTSRQTFPFSPCCGLTLCCVCSKVQDRWPANEAVPQRKPPQKDALC